ncbi:zeta toxin family protein [Alkalimarinus sediminis]|uniref:zeta toxin family protein n=1 Tax=Alkalimarinus sediminis TaxID=1632866 RepID=UPI002264144D|nr:zeta toxin family protein [Alkalimarinus sediminis]
MNSKPVLWVIVGGNGAGKTTFYRHNIAHLKIPFINADLIAAEQHPENPEIFSYQAARQADELREQYIQERRSFCFETVFSHASKVEFLTKAKQAGYEITLVFIHVELAELNKRRVEHRVNHGGHNVPEDKIKSRIPRTIENVKAARYIVDFLYVFDNSSSDTPHRFLLKCEQGQLIQQHPLPEWAANIFKA